MTCWIGFIIFEVVGTILFTPLWIAITRYYDELRKEQEEIQAKNRVILEQLKKDKSDKDECAKKGDMDA